MHISIMKALVIFLLLVGLACLGLGIYSLNRKPEQGNAQPTPTPQVIERVVYVTPSPTTEYKPPVLNDGLPRNPDGSIRFPANFAGWYPIGNGSFTLTASGRINYGGEWATPDGSERGRIGKTQWNDLADNLPLAALVGKIGEDGVPFTIGSNREISAGDRTVYIGINDSYYQDNSGAYTIYKR